MSNILNLETSALACSVSISQNEQLLVSNASDGEWKHSREITLLIKRCLEDVQLHIQDLDAVAISGGPGSYTGLRVGASAAKAICYTQNIPLLSINTLEIIAQPFISQLANNGVVIPLIDARRDEVYFNVYDKSLKPLQKTMNLILTADAFDTYNGQQVVICGDGAEKAEKIIQNNTFTYASSKSLAKNMAILSFEAYKNQAFEDIAYYSPFYLKPPNITKSKKQLF